MKFYVNLLFSKLKEIIVVDKKNYQFRYYHKFTNVKVIDTLASLHYSMINIYFDSRYDLSDKIVFYIDQMPITKLKCPY